MIFKNSTFKEALRQIYREKAAKNPSYSLRAFSKKIGISHSTLLQVFSGKKRVSSDRAWEIGKRLNLPESESEYLFLLVEREKASQSPLAEKIELRLSSLQMNQRKQDLKSDAFAILADWESAAVFATLDTSIDPEQDLGLSEKKLAQIQDRLVRVGLARKENGKVKRSHDRAFMQSDLPHQALRNFYRQMLKKAYRCIQTDETEKRFFGSETFLFDEKTLAEAKILSDRFLTELSALAQKSRKKRAVYHAGLQIFEISKRGFQS